MRIGESPTWQILAHVQILPQMEMEMIKFSGYYFLANLLVDIDICKLFNSSYCRYIYIYAANIPYKVTIFHILCYLQIEMDESGDKSKEKNLDQKVSFFDYLLSNMEVLWNF